MALLIVLLFLAMLEGSYRINNELRFRIIELDNRYSRQDETDAIRNTLSSFILEGAELLANRKDDRSAPPTEWDAKVEMYIRRKLEPSFLARWKRCPPNFEDKLKLLEDFLERFGIS